MERVGMRQNSEQKLRIIHITAAYKPAFIYGGPTMSVAKLCECMEGGKLGSWKDVELGTGEEKLDIEVFTTTANGQQELDVETNQHVIVDGVNVTYFKRLTKDHTHFSPGLLRELRNVLRQAHQEKVATLIHIHAWWNLVSVLSCLIAKWYKIPVILSPRGMLTSYTQNNRNSISKKLIHWLMGKRLLSYCHIHATSEQEKQNILTITKPKSIEVIPNIVELEGALDIEMQSQKSNYKSPVSKEDSDNNLYESHEEKRLFKLIFLSRIEEKKGLEILFEALALVDFNFNLSIGGFGDKAYTNSLKAKAIDLKIDHRIIWLGQVKNEDKFKILQQHAMMVLSSYNENFANVVIESLSVGTAVMLSDQVGLTAYVKENNLGWTTPLNAHAIAKSLKIAFQDVDKRNKIRKLGPSIIARDFNDQTLAQRYVHLYATIVNDRL